MRNAKILLSIFSLMLLLWACEQDSSSIAGGDSQAVTTDAEDQLTPEDYGYGLDKSNHTATFEVTLYNLTPATGPGASQVFSPPVLATHSGQIRVFKRGKPASDEVRFIAEDAVNDPLVNTLNASGLTQEVQVGGGVIFPGASATYTITASKAYNRLSAIWMLVNTNDAFAAANAAKLPREGSRTYYLRSYDAGTEANTELAAHIPGPCCGNPGMRVPTGEKIRYHKGILGVGDLAPDTYDWDEPTAKIVVTRIN